MGNMNAIIGFFKSIQVRPEDFVKVDEEKVERYIRALDKECSFCFEEFVRSDFLARNIITTSCCEAYYFHRDCFANLKKCAHCLKGLGDPSEWNDFVTTAHNVVMQQLGCNDEEYVRELVAREKAEEQAQIQADYELAIRLQNQG